MSYSMTSNAKKKRKQYRMHKASGVCVGCGSKPIANGSTVNCEDCLESKRRWKAKTAKKRYQHHRALGICVECCRAEAIQGQTRCGFCVERNEERRTKAREKAMANGTCYRCLCRPVKDGCKSCQTCLDSCHRWWTESRRRKAKYGKGKTILQMAKEAA